MEDYCTVNTKVWVVIAKGSDAIKRIFLKNDTIPTAVSRWNDFFEVPAFHLRHIQNDPVKYT